MTKPITAFALMIIFFSATSYADKKSADQEYADKPYMAGYHYQTGDRVLHLGERYQCTLSDWCRVKAQWAYTPGTGRYWQHAWKKLGHSLKQKIDTEKNR